MKSSYQAKATALFMQEMQAQYFPSIAFSVTIFVFFTPNMYMMYRFLVSAGPYFEGVIIHLFSGELEYMRQGTHVYPNIMDMEEQLTDIDPFALRKAKIVYNFGLSECNRVKETGNIRNVIPYNIKAIQFLLEGLNDTADAAHKCELGGQNVGVFLLISHQVSND